MSKILLNKSNVDLDYPICRPSLDLDFTQEVLDERITFSRGSIGTRVNRNRLIETVDANQPRFDYDPVTGECKGLLIEESRQNLLTYSEDFSDASWSKGDGSVSTNLITAPDGTTTADAFIENTLSNKYHFFNKTISKAASSITYTFSTFVQQKGNRRIGIRLQSSGSNGAVTVFDLTNATITTVAGTYGTGFSSPSSSIIKYPNNWYRILLTVTSDTVTSLTAEYSLHNGSSSNYTGDGTSGIYIWGAQLEQGSFPTSYIPTTASTVTRSADNASMTGTNFSSWYNQTEGTLYASIENQTVRSSISYDYFVALCGSNVNNDAIGIYTQTASGGGAQNKFLFVIRVGGIVVADITSPGASGPSNVGKAILAYKTDDVNVTVNGLAPGRDRSAILPTCVSLQICSPVGFQQKPTARIQRITYYPRALKPNQLQLLTQ